MLVNHERLTKTVEPVAKKGEVEFYSLWVERESAILIYTFDLAGARFSETLGSPLQTKNPDGYHQGFLLAFS